MAQRTRGIRSLALLGIGGFGLMFGLTASGRLPARVSHALAPWRPSSTDGYQPSYARGGGDELVMIYLGAASCAWSNAEGMPGLVERVKVELHAKAAARGWAFEAVGIALDWDVEQGLKHLRKFGEFDEVSAGRNWDNSLALRYFGAHVTEPPSTPQVIAIHRIVTPANFRDGPFVLETTGEEVLFRVAGGVELKRWVRNGIPVPMGALQSRVGAHSTARLYVGGAEAQVSHTH